MNATIFDVAKWFLSKKSLTHKQLQKLCYYSQAWHLALLNRKLFDEDFQAWIHGPVCPQLYSQYARYGWNKIAKSKEAVPKFDSDTTNVLQAVHRTYSKFDGEQLEALTHSEDPWKVARGNLQPLEPSENVISTDSMRKFYYAQYQETQRD